jgi:hypothetical protein
MALSKARPSIAFIFPSPDIAPLRRSKAARK